MLRSLLLTSMTAAVAVVVVAAAPDFACTPCTSYGSWLKQVERWLALTSQRASFRCARTDSAD
jgi:hypothetical protein